MSINQFTDEVRAIKYKLEVDLVLAAKKMIPNNHIGSNEYIQLTRDQYDDFKLAFDSVIKMCYPELEERLQPQHVRGGFIGRLLNDSDSPAYNLWWMLECVDSQRRMYNQPYYANHPSETVDFKRVDSA